MTTHLPPLGEDARRAGGGRGEGAELYLPSLEFLISPNGSIRNSFLSIGEIEIFMMLRTYYTKANLPEGPI